MVPRYDNVVSVRIHFAERIQARNVHYMMPEDSQGFITEWKGKSIDGKLS